MAAAPPNPPKTSLELLAQFGMEDLVQVEPEKRPSCTGPRPTATSPLSLRSGGQRSTRQVRGGTNWTNRDRAYSRGPRTDNYGNPHPSDHAIKKLGYKVMHHVDGMHNCRTRKTDRPYAKLGRQRPGYQPRRELSCRLDSPEAVVRREMQQALDDGECCPALPARLQVYVDIMDRLVPQQQANLRCRTWLTQNRWAKKRLEIHQQWAMEIRRRLAAPPQRSAEMFPSLSPSYIAQLHQSPASAPAFRSDAQ